MYRQILSSTALLAIGSSLAFGQDEEAVRGLRNQLNEMTALLQEMRAQMHDYQTETIELRKELQSVHEQLASAEPQKTSPDAVQKLEETQQLLDARLEEQYQTKVESASRYRVRLSGAVLFNLFGTSTITRDNKSPYP